MRTFLIAMSIATPVLAQQGYPTPQPSGLLPLPEQMQARQLSYPQYQRKIVPLDLVPVAPVPQQAPAPRPVYVQPQAAYAAPQPAYAQPTAYVAADKPWYVGIKGGYGVVDDAELSATSGTTTLTSTLEFDNGYSFDVMAGYRFHPNFRGEVEIGTRQYDGDTQTNRLTRAGTTTTRTSDASGLEFKAVTVMANAYVDLPIPGAENVAPYVGAGLGGLFQQNGTEETGLAYQLMAGIGYTFQSQTALSLGYRFQQAPDLLESSTGTYDATSHSVEVSLRQHF